MRTLLRWTGGIALALFGIGLALAGAVAAFAGAAVATSSVPVLEAVAVAACFAISLPIGWAVFAVLRGRRIGALWFAGGVTVLACALAAATVLRAEDVPRPEPVPANVAYWDLPTGSRLAYVHEPAAGRARPYPVVFLHGGPGTPGEDVPEAGSALAAKGFEIYAYDQVGAGRSARLKHPGDYTVARHVADLDAVRTAIRAEKIILVGRSWGSTLAARYLAAHPGRVAAAVFVSPGPLWSPAMKEPGEPWNRLSDAQKKKYDDLIGDPRTVAMALLAGINPDAARHLVPDAEADWRFRQIMVVGKDTTMCQDGPSAPVHDNRPGFYSNQLTVDDAARTPDPRPALARTRVPALVMRGTCDFLKPEVADQYRAAIPGARLVSVPAAGHGIANEQPAAYLRLLEGFLIGSPRE